MCHIHSVYVHSNWTVGCGLNMKVIRRILGSFILHIHFYSSVRFSWRNRESSSRGRYWDIDIVSAPWLSPANIGLIIILYTGVSHWVRHGQSLKIETPESSGVTTFKTHFIQESFMWNLTGGAPDMVNFTGNRFSYGFQGCIHIIEGSDGHSINLKQNAISGQNVETCSQ